jgi:hypothetical protein
MPMSRKSLLYRPSIFSVFKIYSYWYLWKAAWGCVFLVIRNFFLLQYEAAFFKHRYPLSDVDHPLDNEIPFKPECVTVYMDFATLWIRTQGFLLKTFGKESLPVVKDYIGKMTGLYLKAAKVCRQNMSTTVRPRYLGKPQFFSIHFLDPHLMCVPSLHVMSAVRTYTIFRDILKQFGAEERFAEEIENVRLRALSIVESILYVKQHSINCIPAAFYVVTRIDRALFPPEEAERFSSALFQRSADIPPETIIELKTHIRSLYQEFLIEGEKSDDWTKPLLNFLLPRRRGLKASGTANAG